jgi:diguanylate cyclase (GGDEF)-like protein
MSLQRRLSLFFIVIVILPLGAGAFAVQRVLVGEVRERATGSLEPALNSALLVYKARADAVRSLASSTVQSPRLGSLVQRARRPAIDRFLRARLGESNDAALDFLVALGPANKVLGSASRPGVFSSSFEMPAPAVVATAAPGPSTGFYRTKGVPLMVAGRRVGTVVGGYWLDREVLAFARVGAADLILARGTTVIASTHRVRGPVDAHIPSSRAVPLKLAGAEGVAQARPFTPGMRVIAWTPSSPLDALSRRLTLSMVALLLVALVVTGVLAYGLARSITQPLDELVVAAKAVSEGRFDHSIPARSRDEVGQLAAAFNDMTLRLRTTITELSSSRDQLRRAIERVGETLRSTHDMKQILEAILNTAADAVGADAAVLWRLTRTRDELYPVVGRGVDAQRYGRVRVGTGFVGHVAERGLPLLRPAEGGPRTASDEPPYPVAIATPLYSQDRILGVIALYRGEDTKAFTPSELETVLFLAEQGGVGIENVQLHEEAQRLSITDGLTGVWNRRYFQMQFRQVLATSIRFHRTFSVLMLDLDKFKDINDTYGHQRGDAILVEFAHRVSKTLREVDTFARYGGEEFICLLSETDLRGGVTAAEKILETIRSEPFEGLDGDSMSLTVSVGVASYPNHGDSFSELVEAADQALYTAKQEGRNRVRVAPTASPNLKLAT